ENRWKFKLDFQYKVKWFNADGFEIAPDSRPWTTVVMPGRTQLNVQATAPNPTATRFEIWVQGSQKKETDMKKVLAFGVVLLAAVGLSGCQTVSYGDATATETVNTNFGSTDLQMIAAKMVDDVLAFPPVVQITAQRRPVMFVDRIK